MTQKASELLKKDIGVLLQKHSNAVSKDEIGAAFNIMKDIDISLAQLSKINDIEVETKNPQENTKLLDWYVVLKFFIETKQQQIIKLNYLNRESQMKHRGTGKTSTIVRLSSDLRIPIFTNKNSGLLLRNREKELNLNAIIIDDIKLLNMPQYKKSGIVLIDEMTDSSSIDTESFIIIGFSNNIK